MYCFMFVGDAAPMNIMGIPVAAGQGHMALVNQIDVVGSINAFQ
jgi:hypothetical protein